MQNAKVKVGKMSTDVRNKGRIPIINKELQDTEKKKTSNIQIRKSL
jgi:hypothetical protein